MLSIIDCILKDNKIDYWLDQGTLLGLTREQDLIDWDWDLDLGSKFEDESKITNLVKALKSNGFYAKYIRASQSVRIEPKNKYYGWRHVDIHFQQYADLHYTTFFYEFEGTSFFQSLLMWLVIKFDWLERKFGRSMPSRRQVYFDQDSQANIDEMQNRNVLQTCIARFTYKVKNIFYDVRLRIYGKFVPVVTPEKWLQSFDKIKVNGSEYSVPANKETYLCFRYGENWRQPDENYDWHDDGAVGGKE
jgi:phosphorylcholine metabolism protein LicD